MGTADPGDSPHPRKADMAPVRTVGKNGRNVRTLRVWGGCAVGSAVQEVALRIPEVRVSWIRRAEAAWISFSILVDVSAKVLGNLISLFGLKRAQPHKLREMVLAHKYPLPIAIRRTLPVHQVDLPTVIHSFVYHWPHSQTPFLRFLFLRAGGTQVAEELHSISVDVGVLTGQQRMHLSSLGLVTCLLVTGLDDVVQFVYGGEELHFLGRVLEGGQ